jgi:6-phosphofructokinase 2
MKIATLTMNPALDVSATINRLMPDKKMRCEVQKHDAGGGGINVARAIKNLGGESLAIFPAGGREGEHIKEILIDADVSFKCIETQSPTRENLSVKEESTGNEYRFIMPSGELSKVEQQACLQAIIELPADTEYLVASGSLPPGVDVNFYSRIVKIANEKNIKCIVDTSGQPLVQAVEEGVWMLKPNRRELGHLTGKEKVSGMELEKTVREIIRKEKVSVLAVSLGGRGALLATDERMNYITPPAVNKNSTVGAGDSMVAAIVLSAARGDNIVDAAIRGVAAGSAATMAPGSELCRKEDVDTIFNWIKERWC